VRAPSWHLLHLEIDPLRLVLCGTLKSKRFIFKGKWKNIHEKIEFHDWIPGIFNNSVFAFFSLITEEIPVPLMNRNT
jgi:hypothetical protein